MPDQSSVSFQPVLVLLHGATANGHMWDPVRRHLSSGYRVVAPDLPGHGVHRGARYTLAAARAAVVEVARQAAPAPLILVGDSLGGYTAIAAANSLPREQLKGLVIGGATFDFTGLSVLPYLWKGASMRALAAVFGEQRFIDRSVAKALLAGAFGLTPEDARALVDAGLSVTVFSQCVAAIRGTDWRTELAAIEQPMIIVNGDGDTVNVRQEASFLARAQHATSRRFDCKHGVSLWRPEQFARVVNEFADGVFQPLGLSKYAASA